MTTPALTDMSDPAALTAANVREIITMATIWRTLVEHVYEAYTIGDTDDQRAAMEAIEEFLPVAREEARAAALSAEMEAAQARPVLPPAPVLLDWRGHLRATQQLLIGGPGVDSVDAALGSVLNNTEKAIDTILAESVRANKEGT